MLERAVRLATAAAVHDDPQVPLTRPHDVEEGHGIGVEESERRLEAVVAQLLFDHRGDWLEPTWRQQLQRQPRATLGPEACLIAGVPGCLHAGRDLARVWIVRLVAIDEALKLLLIGRETAVRGERDDLRHGR